ncbi:MAG: cell cycle transcriptional regulator TrcR, partial [Pseudomonadota bacterium]
LMPKATAVWLVDNTALTFKQIAEFCELHELAVKAIAAGDAAQGIRGMDPITNGQLTREEIKRAEENASHKIKLAAPKVKAPEIKRRKAPKYTPVARRQEKPNAILWLVRNHPEIKDAAIVKLIGTTKTTIGAIRDRSHWNINQMQPVDPVAVGLCTQAALDEEVRKAALAVPLPTPEEAAASGGETLLPVEESIGAVQGTDPMADDNAAIDAEAVFAKLGGTAVPKDEEE